MRNQRTLSNTITIVLGVLVMLLSASMLSSCKDDNVADNNPLNNTPYTISGNGSGDQVVPPVSGSGTGTISGTYTPSSHQLVYTANWNGLTDVPSAGGFYNASAGVNGLAVNTPWTFSSGSSELGSTTGTVTLTEAQAQDLINGNWYYTYGTPSYPGGEVRGQITASR